MKLMTSLFNNFVPSEVLEIWENKKLEGVLNENIWETHAPLVPPVLNLMTKLSFWRILKRIKYFSLFQFKECTKFSTAIHYLWNWFTSDFSFKARIAKINDPCIKNRLEITIYWKPTSIDFYWAGQMLNSNFGLELAWP